MFGSEILDIVIGMVFVFLLLSLVCSALNEFFEALVKNRARDLERGIRELIGDPQNATNFVAKIYNHGLVNSLFKGDYSPDKKRNLPSYIPSANFALAVIDLIQNPPPTGIKLPANVKTAFDLFERQAAGDKAKLQASLEGWFDTGMDRVSGWYKRRTQWILVTLGLIVAIAINADSLLIARTLSNDASLRKALVAMAQARANQPLTLTAAPAAPVGSDVQSIDMQYIGEIEKIGLPIGWQPSMPARPQPLFKRAFQAAPRVFEEHLIGWLLTAIAISMGAPFWFDLLGKIIVVRSTLKPQNS